MVSKDDSHEVQIENTAESEPKRNVSLLEKSLTTTKTSLERAAGWCKGWVDVYTTYDKDSFVFAGHLGLTTILASVFLFVVPEPKYDFPNGLLIIINATVVAWVPSNDNASASKKAIERTLGTLIGSVFGLTTGYISMQAGLGSSAQSALIAIFIAMAGFTFPYVACLWGYRSNYASILSTSTFGLVICAFYTQDKDRAWVYGVSRSCSVLIGSTLAAISTLLLWPTPTHLLLRNNIEKQLCHTGKAAETVLMSVFKTLTDPNFKPPLISLLVFHGTGKPDNSYESYMKCIDNWKSSRDLFYLLKYDLVFRMRYEEKRRQFRDNLSNRLGRAFRIHHTVAMIDSVVRIGVDYDHLLGDDFESKTGERFMVIKRVGERVAQILDLSIEVPTRNQVAQELLETDLVEIRTFISNSRSLYPPKDNCQLGSIAIPPMYEGMPEIKFEGHEQITLLFQLVELLIVRSVRAHYFCVVHDATAN